MVSFCAGCERQINNGHDECGASVMENLVPMTISMISEAENEQSDWSAHRVNHSPAPLDYSVVLRVNASLFMHIVSSFISSLS